MGKEIKVEAIYREELAERVGLYVLALIELARQLQAEEAAGGQLGSGPAVVSEGGEDRPGGSDAQ